MHAQLDPNTRAKICTAPLPRNMHPERNKARRTLRVKAILKQINKTQPQTEVYYTDASLRDGTGVTVVVDRSYSLITAGTELDLNATADMETRAIARAIEHSCNSAPDTGTVYIYTDSQAACRQLRFNRIHRNTANILIKALATSKKCYKVTWVPGHEDMPGNESAHALARALNFRAPEHALPNSRLRGTQLRNIGPVDTRDLLRTARQNRQKHPTPHKTLTRRESAVLRQIQTNALPTVHLTHRFQRLPGTPKCPHCGEYPSIYHTLWTCTQNVNLPPIPNPTPTSWERRLADSSAARTG